MGDTSRSSRASGDSISPSRRSSATSQRRSSNGTSLASASSEAIGMPQSLATSGSSEPLLLPTPSAEKHSPQRRSDFTPNLTFRVQEVAINQVPLLPTPAVNDMGAGKTVEAWDAWTDKMRATHANGNGHGRSLAIEAQRVAMLPTPKSTNNENRQNLDRYGPNLGMVVQGQLSSSAEASPASPQAQQASGWGQQTIAGSGPSSPVWLASYDPDTSSWRTSQVSLLSTEDERFPRSSETWPRSGMTRRGEAFALPMSALPTDANGCSSLPTQVFPTPNTMDHLGPRSPEAQEYQLRRGVEGGSYRNTTGNLREDIARMLPTPNTMDGMAVVRSAEARANGKGGYANLRERIHDIPQSPDSDGEPTNPPSEGGKP